MCLVGNKTCNGFTLIELLVVLAIATLLLAVVPPMISNVVSSAQVKSATRLLAAGLKTARNKAISTQQEVTLAVNVENNSFSLLEKNKQLNLPDDSSIVLSTAKSEQLSDTEGAFRFFSDGSSTGGRIKLTHDPFEYFVDINWLTGKVTISP
jgi:general secretion pathway protein H